MTAPSYCGVLTIVSSVAVLSFIQFLESHCCRSPPEPAVRSVQHQWHILFVFQHLRISMFILGKAPYARSSRLTFVKAVSNWHM